MSLPPLSTVIPPLILGTATFNHQYADVTTLPAIPIVHAALRNGISAFDTSPYYGPSETLLGAALSHPSTTPLYNGRSSIFICTKAGRRAPQSFDYSAESITASVERSLRRLKTEYLDLVYCHDAEFVTPADVITAITALRALQAQGKIRYIGISGYPPATLSKLALHILQTTGRPVDAVLSYGHFCVQNTLLSTPAQLSAFQEAQVPVLSNASILNMGLLTTRGVNAGPQNVWHPAPHDLRVACTELQRLVPQEKGETLETVAIRWAISQWAEEGKSFGAGKDGEKVGITVIGVTRVEELEETVRAWKDSREPEGTEGWKRTEETRKLVLEMQAKLGKWKDYSWSSPEEGFVNKPMDEPIGEI